MNWGKVARRIEDFIKKCVSESGAKGVVLEISGDVDSATTAFLCKRALGSENVLGTVMPEIGVTPKEDVKDAINVCEILGIEYRYVEINDIFECFSSKFNDNSSLAAANIKPRIRMIINYYYADKLNRLVVGTGNKSELRIGYYTKYGDGGVDILPIGDLYKTEVLQLAKYLGVPERIIRKKPSAVLRRQADKDGIGVSYETLDKILKSIEMGYSIEEIHESLNIPRKDVERVIELIEKSRHKRSLPPIAPVRGLIED